MVMMMRMLNDLSRMVNHHPVDHHQTFVIFNNCACVCIQKAVELMSLVPKRCNDMMNLGRLQGYEVHLSVYLSVCLRAVNSQST